MEDYAIIILAAGSSSRMGKAKQLLQINGKTLLEHTIDEARNLFANSVYVVTGANENIIIKELNNYLNVQVCHNPDWQEGMASSIKSGLRAVLTANPATKGCLISVCDQPFLSTAIFEGLLSKHKDNPSAIIASAYKNTVGVPVLFDQQHFPLLMELTGQEGAKKLLNDRHQDVIHVPFPKGDIDLDTPEDYDKLLHGASDLG